MGRQRFAWIVVGLLVSTDAAALDVNVVGVFPNKAVVQIDGGGLQTLSVRQKSSSACLGRYLAYSSEPCTQMND
jgi:hypothetical protein